MYRAYVPELLCDWDRRHLHVRPPVRLIAVPVQLPMVLTAERHAELIAHFPPQRSGLRNFEVVRIAWARLTDEAWLCGDEGEMRLATSADSPGRRCRQRRLRWLVIAVVCARVCCRVVVRGLQLRSRVAG